METGKVVEIIGAVIDVQFARDSMPKVFDALKVDESGLTLEVQQQIGDGIVRTIAMGASAVLLWGCQGTVAEITQPRILLILKKALVIIKSVPWLGLPKGKDVRIEP